MKKSIIFFSVAATALLIAGLFAAKPLAASAVNTSNEEALNASVCTASDRVHCSDGVCVIQDAKKRNGNGCKDEKTYWCVVGKTSTIGDSY